MSNCPNCSAPLLEGAVFCSQCGVRVDGKKKCPKCERLIGASDVFCAFCGQRVDGAEDTRSITISTPDIGTTAPLRAATSATVAQGEAARPVFRLPSFKTVVRLLSPSLLLLGLLVLFICSFTIGFSATISASGQSLDVDKSIFFYFKEVWVMFSDLPGYSKVPFALCLVAICVNFLTTAAMLIVGIVKHVRGIIFKKDISLSLWFGFALGAFVLTVGAVFYSMWTYLSFTGNATVPITMGGKLNAGALVGIIMPSVLAIVAFILNLIINRKGFVSVNGLGKTICTVLGIVLAAVALGIGGTNGLVLKMETAEGYVKTIYSIGSFGTDLATMTNVPAALQTKYVFATIFGFTCVGALATYIAFAVRGLSFKKTSAIKGVFISGLVNLLSSVAYLICALTLSRQVVELNFPIEGTISGTLRVVGPIVLLVLSALALAAAVTCFFLKKPTSENSERVERVKIKGEKLKRFKKVMPSILMLGAIITLFVFSFFIGYTQTYYSNGQAIASNKTVFYFFRNIWQDVSGLAASTKLAVILCLVAICLNFIAVSVAFIVGSIKLINGLIKKQEVLLIKWFALAIGSFVLVIGSILFSLWINEIGPGGLGSVSVYTELSAITYVGIILAVVFAIASYVADLLINRKPFVKGRLLGKAIVSCVGIAVAATAIVFVGKEAISAVINDENIGVMETSWSIGIVGRQFTGYVDVGVPFSSLPLYSISIISSFISVAALSVNIIFAVISLKFDVGFAKKGSLISGVVAVLATAGYVASVMTVANGIFNSIKSGRTIIELKIYTPLIAAGFVGFLLVVEIVKLFLSRKRKKVTE